jgi:NADH dehydrogenase (ubiquinone) 1 alpha/beta subcomplex 1
MFRSLFKFPAATRVLLCSPRVSAAAAQTSRVSHIRLYSGFPPLTKELINERLLEILEGYDKVPKGYKITEETTFSKDLGLDSLDVVEVVMAIEEEFSIGIPDEKVDKINTFKDALDLVVNDPNAS